MAVLTIASNTYKKMLRLKALYLLLVSCILLMSCAYLYKLITMDQEATLLFDGGLAIIFTISILLSLIIGSSEISKEIRLGTLDTLLSKPVGKGEFIMGKFWGTVITSLVCMAILTVGFLVLLALRPEMITAHLFKALILIAVEIFVVSALAILFAVVFGDPLGLVFTFLLVILGHMVYLIPSLLKTSESGIAKILWLIYFIMPNFNILNARNDPTIPWNIILFSVIYGFCYAGFLITLAKYVFSSKDIS